MGAIQETKLQTKRYATTQTVALLKEAGFTKHIDPSLFLMAKGSDEWIIDQIAWDAMKWLMEKNNLLLAVVPSVHGGFDYHVIYSEYGFLEPPYAGGLQDVAHDYSMPYVHAFNDGIASACKWIINQQKQTK